MTPLTPALPPPLPGQYRAQGTYLPGVAAAAMAVVVHVGLWFLIDLMVKDALTAKTVLVLAVIPLVLSLLGTTPVSVVIWSGLVAVSVLLASGDVADDSELRFYTCAGLLLVAGTTAVELASNLRRKPEIGEGVIAIRLISVIVASLVGAAIALGLVELALSRGWDTWFIPVALAVTGVALLTYARELVKRAKRDLPPPPRLSPSPSPSVPPPPRLPPPPGSGAASTSPPAPSGETGHRVPPPPRLP